MIQTSYQLDHASSGFHPKLTGSYSLMINVLEVLAANTGVNICPDIVALTENSGKPFP